MRHEDEAHKLPDDKVGEDEPDDLEGHEGGQRAHAAVGHVEVVDVDEGLHGGEEGSDELAGGEGGVAVHAQDVVDPGKTRGKGDIIRVLFCWRYPRNILDLPHKIFSKGNKKGS